MSRTLISFTVSSSVLKSRYSFDLVYSTLIALGLTILISLPAVIMVSKQKNVLSNRVLSPLYGAYFIFLGAVNICKFAVFSSTELNQNAKIIVLAGFMIIACTYQCNNKPLPQAPYAFFPPPPCCKPQGLIFSDSFAVTERAKNGEERRGRRSVGALPRPEPSRRGPARFARRLTGRENVRQTVAPFGSVF